MSQRDDTYKSIFEPDKGTLLFLTVFDSDEADWRRLMDYLSREYLIVYSEDGVQMPLPNASSMLKATESSSVMLEVMLQGFTLNSHVATTDLIQLNVLPDDVDSAQKAQAVFQLMIGMANILGKPVFLTPELGSATDDGLRQRALCKAAPNSITVQFNVQ